MADEPERWTLTFKALPHPDGVPAAVRMRNLLKRALRSFWLKCVRIEKPKEEPK